MSLSSHAGATLQSAPTSVPGPATAPAPPVGSSAGEMASAPVAPILPALAIGRDYGGI